MEFKENTYIIYNDSSLIKNLKENSCLTTKDKVFRSLFFKEKLLKKKKSELYDLKKEVKSKFFFNFILVTFPTKINDKSKASKAQIKKNLKRMRNYDYYNRKVVVNRKRTFLRRRLKLKKLTLNEINKMTNYFKKKNNDTHLHLQMAKKVNLKSIAKLEPMVIPQLNLEKPKLPLKSILKNKCDWRRVDKDRLLDYKKLSKIDPDISSDIYNKKVLQALNLNYKENFDDDVLIK